jgi:hypothetical protein
MIESITDVATDTDVNTVGSSPLLTAQWSDYVETQENRSLQTAEEWEMAHTFVDQNLHNAEVSEEDRVELTEDEREELYFGQDITLSIEAVEKRRENIENSKYEKVQLDTSTLENNCVLRGLKSREEIRRKVMRERESTNIVDRYNMQREGKRRQKDLAEVLNDYRKPTPKSIQDAQKIEEKLWASYQEMSVSDVHTISRVYRAVNSRIEAHPEEMSRLTPEEITLRACSRLMPFYEDGIVKIYDVPKEEASDEENLSDLDLIRIATASDEQWTELIDTLKEIPHISEEKLHLPSIVDIMDEGLTPIQEEYLQKLRSEGMYAKKNYNNERERVVATILRDRGSQIDGLNYNQSERAFQHYAGVETEAHKLGVRDADNVIALNLLKYGVNIYEDMYHASSKETSKLYFDFLKQNFDQYKEGNPERREEIASIIHSKLLIINSIENDRNINHEMGTPNAVISLLNKEKAADIIHTAGIYQDLLGLSKDWFHRGYEMSDVFIDAKLDYGERFVQGAQKFFPEMGINNSEELRSFLARATPEDVAKIKVAHYLDFQLPLSLANESKEKILALFNVGENGEIVWTQEMIEATYQNIYMVGAQRDLETTNQSELRILRPEVLRNLENSSARCFWEYIYTLDSDRVYPNKLFGVIEKVKDLNYDYEGFIEKYVNMSEGVVYLNKSYYQEQLDRLIEYRGEYRSPENIFIDIRQEDIAHMGTLTEEELLKFCKYDEGFLKKGGGELITEQFIENLGEPESKEFWTLISGLNPYLQEKAVYLGLDTGMSKEDFLSKYTSMIDADERPKRTINEAFVLELASQDVKEFGQNFVLIMTGEVMQTMSETGLVFWRQYSQIEEDANKPSFINFYTKNQDLTVEEMTNFFDLAKRIEQSPSKEVVRLRDEIIEKILTNSESFEEMISDYEVIENLFVRNNSPISILRVKVFRELFVDRLASSGGDTMYSAIYNEILDNSDLSNQEKGEKIVELVQKDILKVSRDSCDENLYEFLEMVRDGVGGIAFYDQYVQQGFTDEQILATLDGYSEEFVMKSLDIFFTTSGFSSEAESVSGRIRELREFLGVDSSAPITEGIYRTYIKPFEELDGGPLGGDITESIQTVLDSMLVKKEEAHNRGLEYYSKGLEIQVGDLVKAVNVRNLDLILENGVLARDFLGASADQDATPYDTDTKRIVQIRDDGNVGQTIIDNAAIGFGDMLIVMRDRGQFVDLSESGDLPKDSNGYELIHSGVIGDNHYGIRTGIGSTEIDYIQARDNEPDKLDKIKFFVAQNGVYIPIINSQGEHLFTPEEYQLYRESFSGVEGIRGRPFEVNMSSGRSAPVVEDLLKGFEGHSERVGRLNKDIGGKIVEQLKELGLEFETIRTGLAGLRIENTGSTSRITNVEGSSDFDFSILMDRNQLNSLSEIQKMDLIKKVVSSLGEVKTKGVEYSLSDGGRQRVGAEIELEDGEIIEFDLSINDKGSDLNKDNTHHMIIERLRNIQETQGEDAYRFVVANIVLAKKFLKKFKCYKKADKQGGLGGVGVENWILQHHGNFDEAVKAFLEASGALDGEARSFEEFKQKYSVWDPGKDVRAGKHDEFVSDNMTESGYRKMLDALIKYNQGEIDLDEL